MPGDYSRKTFDSKKHYSGVLMQQGRVQLDADWNEQLEIQQHRTRTETKDVIGTCGVPKKTKKGNSFKIGIDNDGTDITILPGRIYAGGLLCQLEKPATYKFQPYYPSPDEQYFIPSPPLSPPESPPASPPASPPEETEYLSLYDGLYLVFLDAWQREINYLDDPHIHEVALGEADTTTRMQNVWQVKLLKVTPPNGDAGCTTNFSEWTEETAQSSGKLKAQTKVPEDKKDPCLLPPTAGYLRLENQLYRVQVHTPGDRDTATFKWSRDNASVESVIKKIEGTVITVSDIGKDEVLGFANGQWVEIVDEESTLAGVPYPLMQIDKVDPAAREITLKTSAAAFSKKPNLKLRKWDQTGDTAAANGVEMTADWIGLEGGIEIVFSKGTYHSGDYWLIPARTATGDIEWSPFKIPNTNPNAQPAVGIHHYYCRLALLEVISGVVTITDCRPLFPPLTEISAEDVSFDNKTCEFPAAETVQEAMDLLCAARDLRHHNKHLHGHGVVCGLKVKCGPKRHQVVVENGYALDCEGNDIRVNEKNEYNGILYDIVTEAKKGNLLNTEVESVCLTISRSGSQGAEISIEPYVKQGLWDSILEGSLLKDFYEDCIESLIIFLALQFPRKLTDKAPVPLAQRRLTAFINFIIQLINSKNGYYAFLSGKKARNEECGEKSDEKKYEDKLLWCFYKDLQEFIASETYCAMFDGDTPFPKYPIDAGLGTIFGPTIRFHRRLKLHPSGGFAYTYYGFGSKIYVYDLRRSEFIQAAEFPSSTNLIIQDVAISPEGKELYAVGILDEKDSVFATARINARGMLTWGPTSIKCGVKYVRLAIASTGKPRLYAINKGTGLDIIEGIGTAGFKTKNLNPFNATGLLELSTDGNFAFAAVAKGKTESNYFDFVLEININDPSHVVILNVAGNDDENDILFYNNKIYVTGSAGQNNILYGFNIEKGRLLFEVDLLEDTITRLAVVPKSGFLNYDYLLVTLADRYKVVRVALDKQPDLDSEFRIPVQVFPMDIAVDPRSMTGYVLNPLVNTLTAINFAEVFKSPGPNFTKEPPDDIKKYRIGIEEAFKDLTSHFFQYLKDCFCDKFLIDCPQCGEDDKVYLGCVEIRDNQVHNICNFTKRKYVKSFRTWGYWLSTIPILPLIKKGFAKFCCSIFGPKKYKDGT
jgi:DNA-binding beta-propeller fold protein YncE